MLKTTLVPRIMPGRCKLPHICETCGYEPCVHFGGDYEAERNCWIPPYYHDKGGTPEQYWPDADDDEGCLHDIPGS